MHSINPCKQRSTVLCIIQEICTEGVGHLRAVKSYVLNIVPTIRRQRRVRRARTLAAHLNAQRISTARAGRVPAVQGQGVLQRIRARLNLTRVRTRTKAPLFFSRSPCPIAANLKACLRQRRSNFESNYPRFPNAARRQVCRRFSGWFGVRHAESNVLKQVKRDCLVALRMA
jgi:hypothetical protein